MSLPPGIVYLSEQPMLSPALAVYCGKLVAEFYFGVAIPTWLATAAYVLSGPAVLTVVVQYRDHRPLVPSSPSVPGSIGGINTENLYPGEPLAIHGKNLGYTSSVRLLFQNRILTAEPENIKAILATEFNGFEKGAEFRGLMEPLLGTGVFVADGKSRFHHQMTRPLFHRERISDFDLFDHHAENAIEHFKTRLREGYPPDFQDMVSRFTMDAATQFLFNQDVHSLSAGIPYPFYVTTDTVTSASAIHPSNVFAGAFQEAQMITATRNRFGAHWPLTEPMGVVRDFLDPILREAVVKKRAAGVDPGKNEAGEREAQEGETLLDHLVNYTESTHRQIIRFPRDEILNISVAGRDTTASLLTFTIYMLAEHPNVLSKLRSENLRIVGPMRRPTHDDFRELKYLRAVLNETSRLYAPVTPFATIVMHRRTDLWGPDALEFDPDRFLDQRLHKHLTPNPFIFLPFNPGPRICLGQQFAYHEASFFMVRLLQTFSTIELAPEA
ncbi:cytochrome P450 [Mycena maculata]|uniref:Cytochrome P450 n=1 Tax=Mycena maculata TaxID=230809 RepID=A0AAD7HJ14_9AGAR|nr:cytochrome P450 [Mycena maculata]